jgi:uncharacterized protein (DUF433 family)
MKIATDTKYIVREEGVLGGKPHIASHRIGVLHIAWWYLQGMTAEELAAEYQLTPAEVHAALADAAKSPIAERMRAASADRS